MGFPPRDEFYAREVPAPRTPRVNVVDKRGDMHSGIATVEYDGLVHVRCITHPEETLVVGSTYELAVDEWMSLVGADS